MENNDTVIVYKAIRNKKENAIRNHDREVELECELMKVAYNFYHNPSNKPIQPILDQLEVIAEKGKNEKYPYIETAAVQIIDLYYKTTDYEQTFSLLFRLDDIISPLNEKDFAYKAEYFYHIGEPFYYFKDYRNTIHYMQKVLSVKETPVNWKIIWDAGNTLGLCFQKMNNLAASDYFFHKSLESKYVKPGDICYTIVQGNLAQNHFLRGEYKEALPLAVPDFDNAVKEKDFDLAANAAVLISKIYLKLNDKSAFYEWLKKARFYDFKIKPFHTERFYERAPALYSLLNQWYNMNEQKTLANQYLDSMIIAKDVLNAKLSALYLLRATQNIQAQKMRAENEKLQQAEQKKKFQIFVFSIIVVSLFIISVLMYRFLQTKRKLERLENRRKLSAAEQKLQEAQQHLQTFMEDIAEKERLIKKLSLNAENADELNKVMQSAILTEDNWKEFKTAFETVYPLFFEKLRKKISGISPSEIRLLALVKMKMSRKEIAATLGISHDSIHVTWHRIRKKISTDEKITIEKFVEGF
jgi:DNA-directed RNA polymerase specialized sigma24 family protein